MLALILNLIIYPLLLLTSALFSEGINFAHIYQWIILGFVIAIVNHILDVFFFKPGLFVMNHFLDFVIDLGIVFLSQYVFSNVYITLLSAFLSSILINIVQIFIHFFILKSYSPKK